jgi:hypothetical protein
MFFCCGVFLIRFWFIHCQSFQNDSLEEQEHLLRRASAIYVQLLVLEDKSLSRHKDFIFTHYPYLLGNAIINGFHYLCPGSRHLYTHAWKRIVYFQCCKVLCGLPDICPISVLVHRNQLFLDDAAEEQAFMNKEMNRALIVASATGAPLPMNAGQVDDILPPLAGQGNKDKGKGEGSMVVEVGNKKVEGSLINKGTTDKVGDGVAGLKKKQQESSNADDNGLPAPLLSIPSEFNIEHIHNNHAMLRSESFAESVHSEDGIIDQAKSGQASPNHRSGTEYRKKHKIHHRPNKYKFKKSSGQVANGVTSPNGSMQQHSFVEAEDMQLMASRVLRGRPTDINDGIALDINAEGVKQSSSYSNPQSPSHSHPSPTHHHKVNNNAYWKERRKQSLQPLTELTGTRKSLRFNPDIPQEFKTIKHYINNFNFDEEALLNRNARSEPLARQRKIVFDQSGVSPMVQHYLEHPEPFIKGG